ncbi:MAG: ABC transporter [Crocinitomicaceae bacterium]|nr:ABC transporter [Crocinitomicaceae bacterium]|tara:strand:- start:12591 stop:14498 length:1908 start_codon:yes stop_codon:yes gene_type:complete
MKALRTLAPLFLKYRVRLLAGIVFILFTNVLAVFAPALVGEGVNVMRDAYTSFLADGATEYADGSKIDLPKILFNFLHYTGIGEDWDSTVKNRTDVLRLVTIIALFQAVIYLVVFFIKGIFLFLTRQTIIVNSRLMEYDIKESIYRHYQNLDARFYKSNDTGDLMNRISEDVSRVRMFLGPAVMYSLNLIALIFIVVFVMVSIDLKLTLFSLLPLPLMSIGIYYISSKINKLSDYVAASQSDLSTFAQQHMSGIRVIQSYHRELKAAARFERESDDYKVKALKLVKVEAMFTPIIILLVGLSTVLTVYVGGVQVIEGNLELGHIFQFVFYVNLLTWPFASVGWVTSLVQKAEASMQRILNFLESEPEINSPTELAEGLSIDASKGISFENVCYTYPETGIVALSGLNLNLKPGKTIAITGRTGSGKSTVAQLCMRLMDPTSGDIKYGGVNLKDQPITDYKGRTGYVPQDVFLFSDTIENNISFGRIDEVDSKAIEDAAEKSAVHSDIVELENGYKTILGERGVNLSGGQKQRISIARAILRNPDILILDDCLSAVDTKTEKHIITSLNEMQKSNPNTAILMVSHRISTINHADLIIVIDKGQVVEQGTHEELVKADGMYSEMNEQQLAEAENNDY